MVYGYDALGRITNQAEIISGEKAFFYESYYLGRIYSFDHGRRLCRISGQLV